MMNSDLLLRTNSSRISYSFTVFYIYIYIYMSITQRVVK